MLGWLGVNGGGHARWGKAMMELLYTGYGLNPSDLLMHNA